MAERRRTRGQDGFSEGRNFRPPRQSHARQQEGSERTPRQQQPPMSDSRQATGSRRQSEYFDGGQGRGRGSMYGPPRQQRESYSTGEDQDRPPRDNRESYGGRPSRGFGPSGRGQQDRGSYRGDDRSRRQTVTTFNMSQVQSSLNETESRSRRSENFSSRGRPRGSGYPRTSDRAVTAPASNKCNTFTNYYRITQPTDCGIFMYSICVEPPEIKVERAEKQWIQELIEDLRKKNNHPHGNAIISDNSRTIYCSKMIKDLEDFSFNKSLKTVGKQFSHKFTVKFVKCIKISEMQRKEDHRVLNQALETIFKFCSPEYIEIRRNMYPLFSQRGNDNNYFKILCGLRERVVFTDPKAIYINADLGYAAVIPHSSLIDVVKNLLPRGKNLETLKSERPQIIEEISSKLKGIEATIEHLKYGKKIIKILNKSANDHVFEYEIEDKNHKTSITDYFMKKYQRKLRFPNYPLVQVAPASKDIYMPMELLKIDKWQPVRGNPQIATTEIIKVATEGGCSGRYGDTDRLVNDKFDRINNVLEGFGIVVERTMTHVDDSVLRVPTIQFNSRTITPENGAFVGNFGQFYHSAEIVHLHILDITQKNLSGPLHQLLADVAKQRGLYIKRVSTHALEFNVSDAIRYLRASLPKDCDFCLIIIPQSASDQSYGAIKAVMDIEKGIVSQVVRDRHFEPTVKPNSLRNVFYNIILKINAKAGGINFYAHLTTSLSQCLTNGSQTMVMGVDVNHSMGGSADESAVSMASVVSSLDDKFTKYTNQVCVNQRGCDIVECFEKIMTEALERYKLVNKQYPKRVIVFRDGLSEGQHLHSRVREVESILSALKKTRDGRPLLTFLCVQKRHSTRFYNVSGQQVYDCPPGLLVKDSKICDDKMFYLLSHKAIKGTAKSSQYKIIYNDNKISLDDLANFSFILCHNYARCLRSVSIPAPTYYAHLCALRSNFHRGFVDSHKTLKEYKKNISLAKTNEKKQEACEAYKNLLQTLTSPHVNLAKRLYFV